MDIEIQLANEGIPPKMKFFVDGRPYELGGDPGADTQIGMLMAVAQRNYEQNTGNDIIRRTISPKSHLPSLEE